MSGPKVVRVVTREELVALGEALLSRLNMALEAWQKECASFKGFTAADARLAATRRDELERLLKADKFDEFARAASDEIGFLEDDTSRRREAAAQAIAAERARQTSGRQIANVLLRAGEVSADTRRELERASRGELSVSELDRVLSQATSALYRTEGAVLSPAQKNLASRLGDGAVQSIEEWGAQRAKVDARLQELHAGITELEFLGDVAGAADFLYKLEKAHMTPERAERSMRLDSLQILVRQAKSVATKRASLLKQACVLRAELLAIGSSAAAGLSALNASLDVGEMETVLAEAQNELEGAQRNRAAASRRKVVLEGLAQLGYTVHDGLSTSVTDGGRLVVRSPDRPGYGVEVLASGGSARLQVRTVAFDGARDATQDVKEEQSWCDDFGKLKADLKARGCDVVVERALGVGKVALKLVTGDDAVAAQRRAGAPSAKKAAS